MQKNNYADRYNASTPENVMLTTMLVYTFLLRNRLGIKLDVLMPVMEDATDTTVKVLLGKLRITDSGFIGTAADIQDIIPKGVLVDEQV